MRDPTDETLACWNDDEEPSPRPQGVFTAVSVGRSMPAPSGPTRQLTCWGSNSLGQATPPAGAFTAVSVGELFACGLRTDGTLACWGDDHYLQSSPPSGTFTSIDAGRRHACAIPTGGGIVCWGQDRSGQVSPRPTATMGNLPATTVDARAAVSWQAIALAPIVSYDVRYRRLRLGAKWGSWTVGGLARQPSAARCRWQLDVSRASRSGRMTATAASSSWSNRECTSAPFDDRSLGRSGRWHELSDAAFYRGTALRTSSDGARLSLGKVPEWAGISLVATTCPTCGSVRISWGWGSKTISLTSGSTQHRRVIRVRKFNDEAPPDLSGIAITVVSSAKKVVVDGVLITGRD